MFVNQGEGADVIQRFLMTENLELDHVVLDPLGEFERHYEVSGLPAPFPSAVTERSNLSIWLRFRAKSC